MSLLSQYSHSNISPQNLIWLKKKCNRQLSLRGRYRVIKSYGLNVCVPPSLQFTCWGSNPQCGCIWMGPLRKKLRFKEVVRIESWSDRISILKRREIPYKRAHLLSLNAQTEERPYENIVRKQSFTVRRRALVGNWIYWFLDLEFPSLQDCDK